MTHDFDTVMAYVDGELDPAQRAEFKAALAADPRLQAAVRREQALRQALSDTYDPVLQEPVPAALRAAVARNQPAKVIDFAAAQATRDAARPARRRWSWPQWGALAASVAAGVLLGLHGLPHLDRGSHLEGSLVVDARGTLLAQGLLARALTDQLAGDTAATDAVSVGLSFKDRDGRYCRSFAFAGAHATAGLACRSIDHWEVLATAPAPAPAASAPGSYRTAATALPPSLLQVLDGLRAGDVLDAAGERDAWERGWRP